MLKILYPILLLLCGSVFSNSVRRLPQTTKKWTIQMIGYSPNMVDDYVAVAMEAPTGYIVGFEPVAHGDRVHHILLYGCTQPYSTDTFWKGQNTCGNGPTHILYAWARNAPNLDLPQGVGFAIGEASSSTIKYLVLQVHYASPFAGNVRDYSGVTLRVAQDLPANLAAVLLLVSGQTIPPKMSQAQINMSCVYRSDTEVHPFAFRTHTHAMGRVVSAFYHRDGQWTMVGKRNPQWPQLFQKIDHPMVIKNGDFLAGSCRFDSSDKTEPTPMGAMGTNEMCNFYMMIYWKASDPDPFPYGAICAERQQPHSMDSYPLEGTELLPSHPELEHHAHQSAVPFGVVEETKLKSIGGVKLGQISGLSFDSAHNLIIFHRGSRVWNGETFNSANQLTDPTPIKEDVILSVHFNGANATLVSKTGAGQFYLPHGIFVDEDDSIYVTDVGSHTVSKWKRTSTGTLTREWEAGEHLVPGSDSGHFCKPTAITRVGESLYVSDGYCNARVVELSLDGKYKTQFSGSQGPFKLPHDIVTSKDSHNLYVAEREAGKVHEVRSDGSIVSVFSSGLFNNIYSVDVHDHSVYMIPGEERQSSFGGPVLPIAVFVGRAGTGLIEYGFAPISSQFSRPHVIRVCPHGDHIFVGDISEGESVLWKFKVQKEGANHEGTSSFSFNYNVASLTGGSTGSSFLFFFIFASLIVGAAIFAKRRFSDSTPQGKIDRAGFKPLRMDEKLGISSDESDIE